MNGNNSWWTPERFARLKELLKNEESTSVSIAKELGITRNMVIGKVLRAGLDLPRAKTRLVRGESPATTAIVASKGGSCLWPIGHPSEPGFHFCGAPAFVGKPYCDEHSARAYVKPERRSGERPTTK